MLFRKTVSGVMLLLLAMSMLALALEIQPVRADGTIYIRADGSIDPPAAPIHRSGDTYILTGNITSDSDGIVVQRSDIAIDGAEYTLQSSATWNYTGIDLTSGSNVTIKNLKVKAFEWGINLLRSSYNSISDSHIDNNWYGITLESGSNNSVLRDSITNNGHGIASSQSHGNTIAENSITNNQVGIQLHWSYDNSLLRNNITENSAGIALLGEAANNIISENNVAANGQYGIGFDDSPQNPAFANHIFHNKFINNEKQVYSSLSSNIWDDGYPSGGNYWSDYADIDFCSGPYQNETGVDGIWDHPYLAAAGNGIYSQEDRYPLVDTRVMGIDVSYCQGDINWSKVSAARYKFAFAKATEGDHRPPVIIDPQFVTNMNNGRDAGLLMGAYHFAHPEMNNAVDEARFFISVAGPYLKGGYLRPALDLELGSSLGKELLSKWVHVWMQTVENETGVEPIIYTNPNYATNYLEASVAHYDLWIAHWTYNLSIPPSTGIWDSWDYWQYSNSSSVPGINGYVDSDVFARECDIGITELNVTKTVVGQGCAVNMTTMIMNYGAYGGICNVSVYANSTLLKSQSAVLLSGSFITMNLTWNTEGFVLGIYTLNAYAEPFAGETHIHDNNLTDGSIVVTVMGDINGDFSVNILDAIGLANSFLATPGSSNWNSNADINGDNVVNILDAIILANNFLEHYP